MCKLKTVFLHEFIHISKILFTAQAQQVSSRLPYLAMTLAQGIEALPQRVADSTEITFEDNGILLLRRNMELLQIEKQPVQVAVRAILRRLQLLYFPKIFPLRGWHIRAPQCPRFRGTMEEGFSLLCCDVLCSAVLYVPDVAFSGLNAALSAADGTLPLADGTLPAAVGAASSSL